MTKIISEIGVNWSGDISTAKDMILRSKRAGSDYVKFQLFNEEVIKDSKYKTELSGMILDFEKLNTLREYAFQQYISFGVSVMYPEAFDILKELKMPLDFIKIREADHANEKIARLAVNYCDKNNISLLISTEQYISGDDYFRYNLYHTKHANYLYCVPKYPPELNEISDTNISKFYFDGYSNHYPSFYLPMIAIARELKYVEVHVKYKNRCSIDDAVSINFDELKEVCDFRNTLLKLKGCFNK